MKRFFASLLVLVLLPMTLVGIVAYLIWFAFGLGVDVAKDIAEYFWGDVQP